MDIALLGPQRFNPTLGAVVKALGIEGPIATVTAGWQEREADDRDLDEHLTGRTRNLMLYDRVEQVFREDTELAEAYRQRQERLRQVQDFYRIRLEHAIESSQVISSRHAQSDESVFREEWDFSIEIIRMIDAQHHERCRNVHVDFEAKWRPYERDAIARHRDELTVIFKDCAALAIAGGHVAVLLNRLKVLHIASLVGERPVLAWSAGAMAISEQVVLFHDAPPQGPGIVEILDDGLGLVPKVVPLPHWKRRLRFDDPDRVGLFARRFAPATCLLLSDSGSILWRGGRWSSPSKVQRLGLNGSIEPVEE